MNGLVRDRRLEELASVEFVGSLGEAISTYGAALRQVSLRWHTELGLASTDVRKALAATRSRWLVHTDVVARRVRARRVARRLRRAQTLVAALQKRAERFPIEYRRQFLARGVTPAAAKSATAKGGRV